MTTVRKDCTNLFRRGFIHYKNHIDESKITQKIRILILICYKYDGFLFGPFQILPASVVDMDPVVFTNQQMGENRTSLEGVINSWNFK